MPSPAARAHLTHPARASRLVQVLSIRLNDAARAGCAIRLQLELLGRPMAASARSRSDLPRRLCRCPPAFGPPRCFAARCGRSRARRRAPERPPALAGASARAAAVGPQVCWSGRGSSRGPQRLRWPRLTRGQQYLCVVVRRVREAPDLLHACMHALYINIIMYT